MVATIKKGREKCLCFFRLLNTWVPFLRVRAKLELWLFLGDFAQCHPHSNSTIKSMIETFVLLSQNQPPCNRECLQSCWVIKGFGCRVHNVGTLDDILRISGSSQCYCPHHCDGNQLVTYVGELVEMLWFGFHFCVYLVPIKKEVQAISMGPPDSLPWTFLPGLSHMRPPIHQLLLSSAQNDPVSSVVNSGWFQQIREVILKCRRTSGRYGSSKTSKRMKVPRTPTTARKNTHLCHIYKVWLFFSCFIIWELHACLRILA